MALITKEFSKVALKEESTEGVYAAPANSDFIQLTEDGIELNKTRESLERNLMTGDRLTKKVRLSNRDVEASFSVELTSGAAEGDKPAYSEVIESFGFKNEGLASEDTLLTGSTTSVLKVADASIYKKNDVIKIKAAGAHHISPISAVNTTTDELTLLIPCSSAPASGVVIAKSTLYRLDKTINKSLSLTRIFEGDEVEERATGLRTQSIALSNFTVGQIPLLEFSLMGLKFTDILNSSSFVPSYDDVTPPYVHLACMYKNASKIDVSEIGLSMEQSVSKIKTTCAENGSIGSRAVGKYNISATFNPYKEQDDLGFVLDDSTYSLFWSIFNPTNEAGTEHQNAIAIFLPRVKTTASSIADVDGIHTDSVTAQSVPENESESIVIAFF